MNNEGDGKMTFDSTTLSNIFLACIALTNLVVLAILYKMHHEKHKESDEE
jgi:high-affinity nickel permease